MERKVATESCSLNIGGVLPVISMSRIKISMRLFGAVRLDAIGSSVKLSLSLTYMLSRKPSLSVENTCLVWDPSGSFCGSCVPLP